MIPLKLIYISVATTQSIHVAAGTLSAIIYLSKKNLKGILEHLLAPFLPSFLSQ